MEHKKHQPAPEKPSRRSALNWLWLVALTTSMSFSLISEQSQAETWSYVGGGDNATADSGFLMKNTTALAEPDTSRISETTIYQVKPGDSLSTIADQYGISVGTVINANHIVSGLIRPNQQLAILPVDGLLYKVGDKETVTSIANKYKVSADKIIAQNKLELNQNIIGLSIIVPDAKPILPVLPKRIASRASKRYDATAIYYNNNGPQAGQFLRPCTGMLTQRYSWRHGGIDIADRSMPLIYAAAGGTVIEVKYGGWNGGYGKYALVDHGNGYVTRYAHLSKLYVNAGDQVTAGQAIAVMGSTGRSTGPHLHFEIIENGARKNPLAYL